MWAVGLLINGSGKGFFIKWVGYNFFFFFFFCLKKVDNAEGAVLGYL